MVDIELIKQLREETGISLGECKKALEEGKTVEKAKEILKEWGKDLAAKKEDRQTGQGKVASYIHANGKIGVLIELRCETDFVANSADFKSLSHELCLQVAAMGGEAENIPGQPWIKDSSKNVKDVISETVAKVGENIVLKKAARFQI
ncbi:MAG TPA: elongation factor Ts [Candidatus Pacearchaeota archaeon]|jgi:elongation factor Ts|nr:elongation factor Ts [Bacteroidia bacterium]GMX57852.1 MAG: translation elongation factor Ts [Candidatus Yanofskybacteria bacterium]HNR80844.1 elongation factor Ts [Candidatus Pacearchaeota archaeon]HPO06355.1 elongation factor Ts [Candidatus Pacearchaeota archaeon]